jgi:hypothetical protein
MSQIQMNGSAVFYIYVKLYVTASGLTKICPKSRIQSKKDIKINIHELTVNIKTEGKSPSLKENNLIGLYFLFLLNQRDKKRFSYKWERN